MEQGFASNAVLVTLSIKTWAANTMDRNVTNKVADDHGTDVRLARVWKTLVPNKKGSQLGGIYAIEREARNFHYDNTLPYRHEGQRILPTLNYAKYMQKIAELKERLEQEVLLFLQHFPDIKEQAKEKLKGLYREEDYPSLERLVRAFDINVSVDPLPKGKTFFETQLSEVEIEKAKRSLEDNLQATFQKANEELWDRLMSCVVNLKERLNGDKKFLREGAIDNANELLDLLARLNVNNDQKLEEIRVTLKNTFAGMTAKALRDDDAVREQKSDEVSKIQNIMQSYMGMGFGGDDRLEMKSAA
jgi:hypothetical protein